MEFFLDFLHSFLPDSWFENNLLPETWFNNVQGHYGLTDEEITASVESASNFFNIDTPMNVHEDWTTGVMTGMTFTENDDILIFSRDQLTEMGITDKEGFDLVMTHEGAHRALQGLDTGFSSHQEEKNSSFLRFCWLYMRSAPAPAASSNPPIINMCGPHPPVSGS